MKRHLAFPLALLLLALCAKADQPFSPQQILKMTEAEVSAIPDGEAVVRGIVVFVSGLGSGRFVVAPEAQPKTKGIQVVDRTGEDLPALGDLVHVQGSVRWNQGHPVFVSTHMDVVRNETLAPAGVGKQADFRRGLLEGRRISLSGIIREVRHEKILQRPVSLVGLYIENYTALVRVPGHLNPTNYVGKPVRLTGLAISHRGPSGNFLDAELEVANEVDIIDLSPESTAQVYLRIAIALGEILFLASGVLLILWWRGRRVQHEMEVIAAERRRMAADLHDTIEQHLAGANLLVAGVMALEDTPEDVKEAMTVLTGLLANAKAEVRSAVLNLRSAGDSEKTLEETIRDMADALAKTGVKTRSCLRGLPTTMSEGMFQDIVLILREATTNAVKHGRATCIVFTADPDPAGGFVLKVLNNGTPFEVDRALGPETGHYGLSGMQERAIRNHLSISWGRRSHWTYVQLLSKGIQS